MTTHSDSFTPSETFFAVASLAQEVLASPNAGKIVDPYALSSEQIAMLESLAHHASCVAQEARFAQEAHAKLIADQEERERGEALAYERMMTDILGYGRLS